MPYNSINVTHKADGTNHRIHIAMLTAPALLVILLLFCGGLFLGLLQALGFAADTGVDSLSVKHFAAVFSDRDFARSLGLSLYISTASTAIAALCSLLLALALHRQSRKSKIVTFLLQVPLTVPHLVIAISALLLLAPSGMLPRMLHSVGLLASANTFPLLVNDPGCISILLVYVWKEIPFITFMILSVLTNAGTELLEAGATLNAGRWQRFRYIVLPIISPALASGCLIVFAFTFGAFEVPYLLGRTYPMALPVWAYKNYSDIDLLARPEGIAIGLVIAATVTAAIICSQIIVHFSGSRETSA